jgi:hypothetical protein
MGEISQDTSTGFVSEAELMQLVGTTEELAGAGSWKDIIEVITAISQAAGDGCPTSACTSRC